MGCRSPKNRGFHAWPRGHGNRLRLGGCHFGDVIDLGQSSRHGHRVCQRRVCADGSSPTMSRWAHGGCAIMTRSSLRFRAAPCSPLLPLASHPWSLSALDVIERLVEVVREECCTQGLVSPMLLEHGHPCCCWRTHLLWGCRGLHELHASDVARLTNGILGGCFWLITSPPDFGALLACCCTLEASCAPGGFGCLTLFAAFDETH
mmetsp:Transcript_178692/g.567020  ORF Transcript_178692/g.567020 Transcript_178692/m.567020 type:complete len:205 (+) Transcript_178692:135-749(+)